MHEVGIMERVLELACERAQAAGASRIHRIELRVGAISGVEPDSLEFAFEALKRNTPAQEADLVIEATPVMLRCDVCAQTFEPEAFRFLCPRCGGRTQVLQGRELDLVRVEVSDADPAAERLRDAG